MNNTVKSSDIGLGILFLAMLFYVCPILVGVVLFVALTIFCMVAIPPIESNVSTSNYSVSYNRCSTYQKYRIDCVIKGFGNQSRKFVDAMCIQEADALAKNDPSIERVLAIYRV